TEQPVAVIADEAITPEVMPLLPPDLPLIRASLPSSNWLTETGGFAAILTKPVSEDDIMGTIVRVLGDSKEWDALLVDDDRGFLQLTSRMIEAATGGRASVRAAYSGHAALAKMRQRRPDIVLLDLLMPDMSGFDVAAKMREDPDLSTIPVVAVTAATPGEDQLTTHGAMFALTRKGSFRPGELVALIEATLSVATGNPLSPDS
ncbi:MAG: response regulator, partial [Thermoleophilia bacterium]|nr:response regulator [Thermoleophilia bacterium]